MAELDVEQLIGLWQAGERRLRAAEPSLARPMERIVDGLVAELRRRAGARFSAADLAELYLAGTDWCFEVARAAAPGVPEAWDMDALSGAAFARCVRRATDFGGGRLRLEDEV